MDWLAPVAPPTPAGGLPPSLELSPLSIPLLQNSPVLSSPSKLTLEAAVADFTGNLLGLFGDEGEQLGRPGPAGDGRRGGGAAAEQTRAAQAESYTVEVKQEDEDDINELMSWMDDADKLGGQLDDEALDGDDGDGVKSELESPVQSDHESEGEGDDSDELTEDEQSDVEQGNSSPSTEFLPSTLPQSHPSRKPTKPLLASCYINNNLTAYSSIPSTSTSTIPSVSIYNNALASYYSAAANPNAYTPDDDLTEDDEDFEEEEDDGSGDFVEGTARRTSTPMDSGNVSSTPSLTMSVNTVSTRSSGSGKRRREETAESGDGETAFRTIRELREHCAVHKRQGVDPGSETPFRCALDPCGKTFKSAAGLLWHFTNASAGHFFVSLEEGEDRPTKKFKKVIEANGRSEMCPVKGCKKGFKQAAGLAYHLTHAPNHVNQVNETMVSKFGPKLTSKTRWWFTRLGKEIPNE
ncbi:hypothetical protein MNV49_001948 [Pseudohyphozyma bogoriensis]|nr:hypothetical protein MNV49_001948 [Pseudohyphozyma bogoriensis]